MLDIRLIRDDPSFVKAQLTRRSPLLLESIDMLLALDQKRRDTQTRLQELRSERNRLSKEIGILKKSKHPTEELEAHVNSFAATIEELDLRANQHLSLIHI